MAFYKALNYWVYGGFAGEKSPCEFIDWAKEAGLDGVELTVGDCLKIDISEAECKKISSYAKSCGIGLRSLATGFYWGTSLSAADEAERQAALDFTRKYLKIANWLGASTILVVPGATRVAWDPSRPILSYQSVWERSTQSINELLPLAEELKVGIALENVWNRFLFSPMEWKFYLEQFNSPMLGIYFDVGNCCLYVRPEDYIEMLGQRIKAVHIKNWQGEDAGGNLHGFGDDISRGEVDFKAVFDALKRISYSGPLTAEMIPFSRLPNLLLPDLALASKTAKTLRDMDI
ncbi:MAG: hypothetical protein A2X49_06695 [Lentisphaerae bacterium GWF2_52_8]|nr:MAG: hypothetical protein A2X49_06695 [Lentisphaerae bacterium GWF2_52_8]